MDELIERITGNVGIEPHVANQAVGMMLGFLKSEGPEDKVATMMDALPDASSLIETDDSSAGGGILGAAMSAMGGGGVMGLGQQLMGLGLGMGEISGVAKETVSFAKEKAGDDVIDDIVGSIPGLSQFV